MKRLASYVCGKWHHGGDDGVSLRNPATETVLATASASGIDLAAALEYARQRGGPALREMTFRQRARLLRDMARAIHDAREALIELAVANGGNTRKDAKFDIDGASFTLAAYADLGEALGDVKLCADGDPVVVGRTARLSGQHVWSPRRGVAVHVNAFNFPAWGTAEKAAAALLAGMPVVSKPASATALVAFHLVEAFVDRNILPDGALSLVCGSAHDLLDHLAPMDALAFTGSSTTAHTLRALPAVVERSVAINVEADSLNAAVLAPDVSLTSDTGQLFVHDVVRDMTQKAGQKCTAIRRVLVPDALIDDVTEALRERLAAIVVGDPADDRVHMGPVATAAQRRDVLAGIERLSAHTEPAYGQPTIEPLGVPLGTGFFVGPVLRLARDAEAATAVHEHEVFGPVATLCSYSGDPAAAARTVALGQGGLVCSIYSDDREFYAAIVPELAPLHGRLMLGSAKIAAQSPGPGTVIPTLLHGGPGRAGGGQELGGERGLRLYQQRTALQGDTAIISALLT